MFKNYRTIFAVLMIVMVAGGAFAGQKIDDPASATLRVAGNMDLNRDGVLNFTDFEAAVGFNFFLMDPDPATGSVSQVIGDFQMLYDSADWTYADDLTLLVANADLSDVLLQVGGWDDTGAANRFAWPVGGSNVAGPGGGVVDLGMNLDITGYYLYLGNGYSSATTGGIFTGSITLIGDVVDNDGASMGSIKAMFR